MYLHGCVARQLRRRGRIESHTSSNTQSTTVLHHSTIPPLYITISRVSPPSLYAIYLLQMDMSPLVTFLRAVGGGTFVCLAIFLARCSGTMTGKAVGIMFPISTYIICGFEHCLASMFFVYTAKMNGLGAAYGWKKILVPLATSWVALYLSAAVWRAFQRA